MKASATTPIRRALLHVQKTCPAQIIAALVINISITSQIANHDLQHASSSSVSMSENAATQDFAAQNGWICLRVPVHCRSIARRAPRTNPSGCDGPSADHGLTNYVPIDYNISLFC